MSSESAVTDRRQRMEAAELERQVERLGPWFHNLNIGGVQTAPDHPLGNFLDEMWWHARQYLPEDMTGLCALDIGCNAGFYSQQLRRRGAQVLGIDHDEHYLTQARFAAAVEGLDIEFRRMDVYELDQLPSAFDYVLFMGVFYHLRHPLLGLDKVVRLVRKRLIFQSMIRGGPERAAVPADAPISERAMFEAPGFPCMYFIEHRYAGDPTNWWVPNEAGMEAMLRSAGMRTVDHPFTEMWICEPAEPSA